MKEYYCGMCKKEIKSGSVCNKCTSKIDKYLNSVKQNLHKAISINEKNKRKQG